MIFLGAFLIVIGLILRGLAVWTLGSEFSEIPHRPHRVKTYGIYRILKHPAYLGSILIFAGLAIVLPTDYRLFLDVYLLFVVLNRQAKLEESYL